MKVCLPCVHCGREKLIKHGFSRGGKPQYRCHGCGRRSTQHATRTRSRASRGVRGAGAIALLQRPSMRGIRRATGVSRQTLTVRLKKRCADEARHTASRRTLQRRLVRAHRALGAPHPLLLQLSFSKSLFMHLVTLRLVLVLYNSQKAKNYLRANTAQ